MLVILDGWGWRDDPADNAIRQAKTPTFDRLWHGPHGFLRTSGNDVGLPDGQMGNSEVGHLNIGAGRVVMQDLPRIGGAIANGDIKRLIAALPKSVSIATVCGRYYAMDRDKRWERVAKAYNAIVEADGPRFSDAPAVVADAYANKKFDEFIIPAVVGDYRGMKEIGRAHV